MDNQLASNTFVGKSHVNELASKPISLHGMKTLTCSDHCDVLYFLFALAVTLCEVKPGMIRSGLLTLTDKFPRVEMQNLHR